MKLLDKNNWLNFCLSLFGFYFLYELISKVIGRFYTEEVISATHLAVSYHWVVAVIVALILTLLLVFLFCKPRAPLFIALAIFCAATFSLFSMLYTVIVHLDPYLKKEGLAAFAYLLPHLIVILISVLTYYITWFSNSFTKSSE